MKQIVVHCERGLTRAALLEQRQLVEYFIERASDRPLVGSIVKGRVVNVLPGMQAAFVDIGLSKNAFLYIDDLLPAHLDKQPKVKPSIADLVSEGQELIVQIAKEPIGTKGARITTHISIPGRWIVYMPTSDYVAVSRKITDEAEQSRLKQAGESLRKPGEGLIMRTVAEGESASALMNDMDALREIWTGVLQRGETCSAPTELYSDQDMLYRLVRDSFTNECAELLIDNAYKAQEVIRIVRSLSPEMAERVKLYQEHTPIMEKFGIDEEVDRLFRHKVWLDNGGYLIVDQTEALTVIDVNTGKFTGSIDLEQTVYSTNMEAAELIARLLRLRDIGGIIIVDFIDMGMEAHRQTVIGTLEEQLRKDRTKTLVVGWTKLGLLELTRKKIRDNKETQLFDRCPSCNGTGKLLHRHK